MQYLNSSLNGRLGVRPSVCAPWTPLSPTGWDAASLHNLQARTGRSCTLTCDGQDNVPLRSADHVPSAQGGILCVGSFSKTDFLGCIEQLLPFSSVHCRAVLNF